MIKLSNKFIKHKQFKDVCFQVEKVFELPHKLKIKGNWINQGFTNSWILIQRKNIIILKEDYKDWEYCLNSNDHSCLRYCDWKSII